MYMELPKLRLPNLNASGLQTGDKFNLLGDYLLTMERNLRFVLSHLEEDNFSEGLKLTGGGVTSINGQTGDVTLETGGSGGIAEEQDPTVGDWAKQENPPTYSKADVGLGNVANERQYSANNPPPYPVTSVNGQTGAVTVEAGNTSDPYPVGAIYISTSSTSPASLFGGTWEQIKDRFLLAAGSTYTAGKTGGAATHKLTESEMPSHYHTIYQQNSSGDNSIGLWDTYVKSNYPVLDQKYDSSQNIKAYAYGTGTKGGSAAHNNMPPYLTVYVWKRVS